MRPLRKTIGEVCSQLVPALQNSVNYHVERRIQERIWKVVHFKEAGRFPPLIEILIWDSNVRYIHISSNEMQLRGGDVRSVWGRLDYLFLLQASHVLSPLKYNKFLCTGRPGGIYRDREFISESFLTCQGKRSSFYGSGVFLSCIMKLTKKRNPQNQGRIITVVFVPAAPCIDTYTASLVLYTHLV